MSQDVSSYLFCIIYLGYHHFKAFGRWAGYLGYRNFKWTNWSTSKLRWYQAWSERCRRPQTLRMKNCGSILRYTTQVRLVWFRGLNETSRPQPLNPKLWISRKLWSTFLTIRIVNLTVTHFSILCWRRGYSVLANCLYSVPRKRRSVITNRWRKSTCHVRSMRDWSCVLQGRTAC